MHLTPRRTGGLVAAAALALALAPASAGATTVAGGTTTLKLDKKAAAALKSLGVKATPTGAAKASSAGIVFPVTGGDIDFDTIGGLISHKGGLRLSKGATRVTLSDFNLKVGPHSGSMSASVNGKRSNALQPDVSKSTLVTTAAGTRSNKIALYLSGKGAAALNKAFKVHAFSSSLKLGTLTVVVKRGGVPFAGGETDLVLDPGAAAALQSLGVAPAPLAGATKANPDGSIGFPISGGEVDFATLAGSITHLGGITLTKGATVVTLSDFVVDTTAKTLTATLNGGAKAAILSLDLGAVKASVNGRELTVGPVPLRLTQAAADALNSAFATTAFTPGLLLGVATVHGRV